MSTQALAEAAPSETLAALRAPLEEALAEGTPQDEDRARTCAAAEALSGLLACSATYASPGAARVIAVKPLPVTNGCGYMSLLLSPRKGCGSRHKSIKRLLEKSVAHHMKSRPFPATYGVQGCGVSALLGRLLGYV